MDNPEIRRVLVVEDDEGIRETLRDVLEDDGYAVDVARNGREALDFLATGVDPDLIVLDLMMPVMNGHEFRARQMDDPRLSRIPVLVISAAAPVDPWCGEEPRFVRKPFSLDTILGAVGDLSGRATM